MNYATSAVEQLLVTTKDIFGKNVVLDSDGEDKCAIVINIHSIDPRHRILEDEQHKLITNNSYNFRIQGVVRNYFEWDAPMSTKVYLLDCYCKYEHEKRQNKPEDKNNPSELNSDKKVIPFLQDLFLMTGVLQYDAVGSFLEFDYFTVPYTNEAVGINLNEGTLIKEVKVDTVIKYKQ